MSETGRLPCSTAEEAVAYIHSFSWLGSRPGLERTRELLRAMGDPQDQMRFVHIVGTNGKGSTAVMLARILSAGGYTTGLYTSPYIHRFQERMTVDGEEIGGEELAEITSMVGALADAMEDHPTEFELVTCIALEFYRRRGCQIVVLEAGMGGRLDSTNVIPAPELVIITNIGLDHTQQLGATPEAIAREKAAVIKAGCPVVLYPQTPGVTEVVEEVCRAQGASLYPARPEDLTRLAESVEGQVLSWRGEELTLPLLGENQRRNAAVVLRAVEVLSARWPVSPRAVAAGLAGARWPGRFEIVGRRPWFVVDGGHNPQCAQTVADNLERYFPGQRPVLLLGVLEDKDYGQLCRQVAPLARALVTVTPPSPRALPAQALAEELRQYGKPVTAAPSIREGAELARTLAGEEGLVCALGSLYSVAALRACFGLS